MSTSMQIPEGKKLVQKFSHRTPDNFVSCQQIWIEGSKKWQFWLPKRAVAYTVLVDK